jgi:hydroxypyruvate isomerase
MITSIHLSYILGDLPLQERFPAARDLGFKGVEYPFPYETPASSYASLLADHGLQQISIGAPACDYRRGEPGFSITPALQGQFDRSLDTAIAYATGIRCKNVHVFAGRRADDVPEALALDTYCRNLQAAHDRLAQHGLRLVIEAINAADFPGYFMNRLDRVVEAIDVMQRPGTGIIFDVYHASMNGEDACAFMAAEWPRVAHIQLADYPGRHEPGTGQFDFQEFVGAVRATRYSGSIGLEYVPTRSVFEGVPLASELARLADQASAETR